MKLLKFLPIVLILSCIDLITQKTQYNSLFFEGGSWIEIAPLDSMKMDTYTNDFTLQFWVSGGEVDTNEAPALFSLIDSQDSIKLALFRDKGNTNSINTIINSEFFPLLEDNNLDWSNSDNFYLISLLFSDTSNIKIYVNNTNLPLIGDSQINIDDTQLMVGALVNNTLTMLENFWYGYIDEIRLWNTILADSTILFQSEHPDKLGEYYRYTDANGNKIPTYLDSLIGIWRLNFEDPITVIEDNSGNSNDGNIYTLTGFTVELSEKGAQ